MQAPGDGADVDPQPTPRALAELAVAVAARETADACYALVARLGDLTDPDDLFAEARKVRSHSADVWQLAVLTVLLHGKEPTWAHAADLIGWNEVTVRGTFQDTVDAWQAAAGRPGGDPEAVGHLGDPDPLRTAQALDLWLVRHREPWDDTAAEQHPVQTALQRS
jgi:hypothetical protein